MRQLKKNSNGKPLVVVLGGGTGTNVVLTGLRSRKVQLAAVVAMADDGGSTGMLRRDFEMLPPGDVRQCLTALCGRKELQELLRFRFSRGSLAAHNLGNLILTALCEQEDSFERAIEKFRKIFKTRGLVIPSTLDNVFLAAQVGDQPVRGQNTISGTNLAGLKKIWLKPAAKPNPQALEVIRRAKAIVIGPGDFYSSIAATLIVPQIARAISESRAQKIYVCNLMTKPGHTDGWKVDDFIKNLEIYLGCLPNYVIYNNVFPAWDELGWRPKNGETFVMYNDNNTSSKLPQPKLSPRTMPKTKPVLLGGDLVNRSLKTPQKGDLIARNPVVHNSGKLANLIMKVME